MSIFSDFLKIIDQISKKINIPSIQDIFIPPNSTISHKTFKKSNFGAILLEDGTVGVFFVSLSPEIKEIGEKTGTSKFIGMNPMLLAKMFGSSDIFEKTLGFGAINAISQYIFKKSNFSFDFTTDSLGLLNLRHGDNPGMVGFFPPLVKKINEMKLDLIIIEKKSHLVKKTANWEVTLDPRRLTTCNKVLITSTTVLNETLDEVLKFCAQAEKISIIGPTAGFFPDPLFSRGVNIVGGTYIHDTNLFMELISEGKRWGPSTKKYCIQKANYPGISTLLDNIKNA